MPRRPGHPRHLGVLVVPHRTHERVGFTVAPRSRLRLLDAADAIGDSGLPYASTEVAGGAAATGAGGPRDRGLGATDAGAAPEPAPEPAPDPDAHDAPDTVDSDAEMGETCFFGGGGWTEG